MNNKDNEAKRIRSLINSHLYDLEGIKNSKSSMQDVCTFYRGNFGAGEDYKHVRNLVYEYTEIVDYFLKVHTELSNEQIDNCIDSLNSIRYKILRIGKQNVHCQIESQNSRKITVFLKWFTYFIMKSSPREKDYIIKPTSKNVLIRELRGKLIDSILPVISHRKLNEKIQILED